MPTFTVDSTHTFTLYQNPERIVNIDFPLYKSPERNVTVTFPLFGVGSGKTLKTTGQIWPRSGYDR